MYVYLSIYLSLSLSICIYTYRDIIATCIYVLYVGQTCLYVYIRFMCFVYTGQVAAGASLARTRACRVAETDILILLFVVLHMILILILL